MIDGTTKTGRIGATVAILTAAACGLAMNFMFSRSIGSTEIEKNILSVFGVSLDIVKLLALSVAAVAWSKGYRLKAVVMFCIWAIALTYGLLAAFGFAAMTRDSGTKDRIEEARPIQEAITLARANGRRFDELTETVRVAKMEERFRATVGCLDATIPRSKIFCQNYREAVAELAILADKPKIMSDDAAQEQMRLAITADPQIALIADLTGFDPRALMFALTIFLAIAVEAVTAFGVYGFSRSIKRPERPSEGAVAGNRGRPRLVKVGA